MDRNDERIDGSGLFFFKSSLSKSKKIEILDWFEGLTDKEKEFVKTLMSESSDDATFFTQE